MHYSKDIVPLTKQEVLTKLGDSKREYMNLRFQNKLDSNNQLSMRKMRKNIARLKTSLSERNKK